MKISSSEWKRKAVHAGMGLFAFALRWLDWKVAAAMAFVAILFNLFVMPRIGRGIYRDSARKRDAGIVAYPVMVLVVLLLFRYQLELAAALWAMMAFGDPAASVVGKLITGPALPWNSKKRWSGLIAYWIVGGVGAVLLWRWVSLARSPIDLDAAAMVLAPVALLGGFLESLDSGIDDNWLPPIPCALILAYAYTAMLAPRLWGELPSPLWLPAVAVNTVAAATTGMLGIVSLSGAVAGGIVGTVLLALCGWSAYAVLWGFFLFGTLATRLGFLRKKSLGTAQAQEGKRGSRHVLANCGVATLLCIMGYFAVGENEAVFGAAFVATFAAALADTLGTEIGSLYGRRPLSFVAATAVPAGTPGAVSLAGLLAGLLGAALMGAVGCLVGLVSWKLLGLVAAAGSLGSVAESLLWDLSRWRGIRLDHEFANAFNTFVAAVMAWEIATWLRQGYVSIPFDWRVF